MWFSREVERLHHHGDNKGIRRENFGAAEPAEVMIPVAS